MTKFSLGEFDMYMSQSHIVGTDAFLLAKFANPKSTDTVCDLCTGCGIIPLLFYKNKKPLKIYGIEIQKEAVDLFNLTIAENKFYDTITIVHDDLRSIPKNSPGVIPAGSIDLVSCNPPYMKVGKGAIQDNVAIAIAKHEIMCTIDDVCKTAEYLLKFGGDLKMCQRPERLSDVITAMKKYKIEPKQLITVHKDIESPPWLFLISGKKGANPGIVIEKPLISHDKGEYTEEFAKIYE